MENFSKFDTGTPPEEEDIERKKERLQPIFEQSLSVFRDPDRSLYEGTLTVTRQGKGQTEVVSGLVVLEVLGDAIELGGIEDDGDIGASAFMSWEEIVDVVKE
ncbi:hypothetical protein KKF05_00205 [Patescibacteria group bacterium]|nr:hypothetical protein [Patescibacteria group bacterium]MBU1028841.1 hypothetical protein [Patescibacteria group bacterium]MBU1916268.1 hypothetical protein [Patescibacteria group bacterium]